MLVPIATLGVPLMDRDHAHFAKLLLTIGEANDAALPELLLEVEDETRAHFAREEELMGSAGVPILHCHIAQHAQFLSEFDRAHDAVEQNDMAGLREFLCVELPRLFRDHVDTVDRVTSGFLRGPAGA
jgi:hemerythrin-like metal-binding protein